MRHLLCIYIASQLLGLALALPKDNKTEERTEYAGFQVLTLNPETEEQADLVIKLKSEGKECEGLDLWSETEVARPGAPVTVSVPPECVSTLEESLSEAGVAWNVTIS